MQGHRVDGIDTSQDKVIFFSEKSVCLSYGTNQSSSEIITHLIVDGKNL